MSANTATYQQAMRDGHALAWALKWEAAVERYRVAVFEFPEDAAARNSLATALFRMGRLDDALNQYQALLALTPQDEMLLTRLADIQHRRGDRRETTTAYLALADHYLQHGQRVRGIETWLKLAELLSEDLDAQERLYQVVSKAGESALAGRIALTITRLRGDQASHGINPFAVPAKQGAAQADRPGSGIDPALLTIGLRRLATARADHEAGRGRDAILGFAAAVELLQRAGAGAEAAEAESLAHDLIGQFGAVVFADLVALDEAARPLVVDFAVGNQAHVDQGQPLVAIDECLAVIAAAPEYLPVQERLATLQAACCSERQAFDTYISLAQLYLLRGQSERAKAAFARAAALSRGSAADVVDHEEHAGVVDLLLRSGMQSLAVEQLISLAERLVEQGRAAEALSQLERAVRIDPQNTALLVQLARAQQLAGDHQTALETARRALQIAPRQFGVALTLSIVAALSGSVGHMEEGLQIVLEAAENEANATEALCSYTAALAASPDCGALNFCRGAMLVELCRWEDATACLQKATTGEERVACWARLLLARCALEQEGAEAALRHLAAVQRLVGALDGKTRSAWRRVIIELQRLWADVCVRRGELETAVTVYSEIKRLAPRDRRVHTQLAETHFRMGNSGLAVVELVALGELYRADGQPQRALAILAGAAQVEARNPVLLRPLIEAYTSLDRTEEAVACMDTLAQALAEAGDAAAAAAVLRQMLDRYRQTDPAQALAIRERAARLLPDDAETRLELVAGYLGTGNSNAALAEAHALWADMVKARRPDEAIKALQLVLQIDPWNADAMGNLGALYEELAAKEAAVEMYRRALSVNPEDAHAADRLAELAGREAQQPPEREP